MNYSTKNRDVIKIFNENIKSQNQGLTDMTESNYTQIAKTRNLMKVNSEIVVTHKIMIIAIIILSIIIS